MSKINEAWSFIENKLFYPKTNLFYECRVSDDEDALICHLPSPELIKKQIPNPAGWSTGMEDGPLTAGMVLDGLLARYETEPSEEIIVFARKILEGMKTCATISDSPGFLVRSVSPVDGKTHYMNSSRDQYTHFVYSACLYYNMPFATDEEKAFIRKALCSFADRAERNVTEEKQWNMRREDDGFAIVTTMWGTLGKHEYFRLPMLYAGAYYVSGDEKYMKLYRKFRDEAFEKTASIEPEKFEHPSMISQMMYSLRLAYDVDPDTDFKARCLALMQRMAEYGKKKAVEFSQKYCTDAYRETFDRKLLPWDQVMKAEFVGVFDGYAYYNHLQLNDFESARWILLGETGAAMCYVLCPGLPYDKELEDALLKMIDFIDYNKHYTVGPTGLMGAYHTLLALKRTEN